MAKVIDVDFNNMDRVFDEMVEEQAKQCRRDMDDAETKKVKKDAIGVLSKFKDYISSAKFKMKCFFESKDAGVPYSIVRNGYVKKILGKIADVLGLAIEITGEVVQYAVKFLSNLVNSIVNLTVTLVKKIISLFTLNCGTHCNA